MESSGETVGGSRVEAKIKESTMRTPFIEALKPDEDDDYTSINYMAPREQQSYSAIVNGQDMDFREFLSQQRRMTNGDPWSSEKNF